MLRVLSSTVATVVTCRLAEKLGWSTSSVGPYMQGEARSRAAAGVGPCGCDTHTGTDTVGSGGGSKSVVGAVAAAVVTAVASGGDRWASSRRVLVL